MGRRAVVFALGIHQGLEPLSLKRPAELLTLVDTPIIVHVITTLARMGIKKIELLLHHFPEQIRESIGGGERWGVEIHPNLVKDPSSPLVSLVPAASRWSEEEVLVACAHRMPSNDLSTLELGEGVYAPSGEWTGWGVCSVEQWQGLNPKGSTDEIGQLFSVQMESDDLICCQSFTDFLESNRRLLSHPQVEIFLPSDARVYEEGVWVGRGVRISPDAEVSAPCYVGSDSQVEGQVVLGPYASVDHHCFIDTHSYVKDSVVFADTYVGENLEVERCIVDRQLLVNARLESAVEVFDEFILSNLKSVSFGRKFLSVMARLAALVTLVVLSPFLLFQMLTKGIKVCAVVGEKEKPIPWLCFSDPKPGAGLWDQFPALYCVAMGWVHWVGLGPRTRQELDRLSADWKSLYLTSKIGWLTQAHFLPSNPTVEEVYSSDLYYAGHQSVWGDFKMIIRYFCQKLW